MNAKGIWILSKMAEACVKGHPDRTPQGFLLSRGAGWVIRNAHFEWVVETIMEHHSELVEKHGEDAQAWILEEVEPDVVNLTATIGTKVVFSQADMKRRVIIPLLFLVVESNNDISLSIEKGHRYARGRRSRGHLPGRRSRTVGPETCECDGT